MLRTKTQKHTHNATNKKTNKKKTHKSPRTQQRRALSSAQTMGNPKKELTFQDLYTAAQLGDVLQLKECLEQQEPKLDVNGYNNYKQTPLILAIKHRQVKSMQLLLKNGADPNLACGQKITPFFHAIKKNSVSLFRALMEHNPETSLTIKGNISPMTWAGQHGAQPTILNDLHLTYGFNVDHRDITGSTPLMYAVKSAPISSVEWFLNNGANPITKNKLGKSALDNCMRNHNKQVGKLVRTRSNELRKYNRIARIEENEEVQEALKRLTQVVVEKQ